MQTDPVATPDVGAGTRWSIMVVSLLATASSFLFINGVAFLIPSLQGARGIRLDEAGLLASMPSWGMVVTLVAWGYVLDRVGERVVMTTGSALTALAAYAASSAHSMVLIAVYLFLGGMAAASCNTAGGRLVSAWFPPHQRGLAMGIRQTAQPLGIALGAMVIPELAEHGPQAGLRFTALACVFGAVASVIGIVDPPRKPRASASDQELASPYRGSLTLWRIHAVAGLMMMPQTVTVTFMLVWLIRNLHWSVAAAGALVTLSQLLGALGRVAVGSLVGPARLADAARPLHRGRGGAGSAAVGLGRLPQFAVAGRPDGGHLGDRGARQRAGGHRDHRIRRAVLEWTRPGHPEHHPADDGGRRSAVVRRVDFGREISTGMAVVRVVPLGGDAAGADAAAAARLGN